MSKQFTSDIVANAYQQESQLIAQLYTAASEPDALPRFMNSMLGLLNACNSVFGLIENTGKVARIENYHVGFEQNHIKLFDDYFCQINILNHRLPQFLESHKPQKAFSLNDVISDEEYIKTEFYNDWSKNVNMRYGSLLLIAMPDHQFTFSINRTEKQGTFHRDEMAFIDRIAPHMTNVIKIQQKINSLDTQNQRLTAALYNGKRPYLLFDQSLNVIFTNQQAETLFRQSNTLTVSKGKLKARHPQTAVEIRESLTNALNTMLGDSSYPDRFVRVKREGLQDLLLHISPINIILDETEKGGATQACASIEIYDPNQEVVASNQIMEELFSLTPAEVRLARDLAVGKSLQNIEQISNTSMNTLKTHLKGIFRKTDTSRQPELVAKLSNLPRF